MSAFSMNIVLYDRLRDMNQLQELNWFRRFYRQHLARYAWARLLKQLYLALRLLVVQIRGFLVWRVSHKLAVGAICLSRPANLSSHPLARHSSKLAASYCYAFLRVLHYLTGQKAWWYTMRGFSEYCKSTDAAYYELVPARDVQLDMPTVHPEANRKYFPQSVWPLRVPSIYAFEVSNAQVMGKSDLLYRGDECLHHDLYRFRQDFLFEEMHDFVSINAANKKLVRFNGRQVGSIPSGISLVGSATANYVHWLTETLPKLALIDGIDAYQDLPHIIVDAGLHPNILESLHQLNLNNRKVFQLGRGELLSVDKLVAISPVAYIPFDFKPGIKPDKLDINPGSALYSPDGLQQVRQSMVSRLGEASGTQKKRLFLRRTGKSRPMNNSNEIEAIVLERGFEIVEPEKLSFAEQVRLFSGAELIVSQGGAALGNIIFAPAGCHVVVLTTWSPYTIHYYFSNLAALMGQRCTLIMCEPVQSDLGPHRAHMGVNVSIQTLIKAIQQ
jgi:hypothetical protein